MKKTILFLILALANALTATAQDDLIGSWTGKLDLCVAKLSSPLGLSHYVRAEPGDELSNDSVKIRHNRHNRESV